MITKPKPPYLPPELLSYLRDVFPNCVPTITDLERAVWAKVGQQDVIRHLKKLCDAQEKLK